MISDKIENTNNVAISNENIDTTYFDIDTSCKKIGIKKTSLYTKYLNNKNLNIQKYHIQGSKKTYLHLTDIEQIIDIEKNKTNTQKLQNENRISKKIIVSESTKKEVSVDITNTQNTTKNPNKKTTVNNDYDLLNEKYKNNLKLIAIYEELINELKKDKDELNKALTQANTALTNEQTLNLKDKKIIESLTLQLETANQKLQLTSGQEEHLRNEFPFGVLVITKISSSLPFSALIYTKNSLSSTFPLNS